MSDDNERAMLALALDSMRDMVLIKGPQSQLLWANRAFLDLYGMTREALRDMVDGPQSDPDDTMQYVRDDALVFQVANHVDVPSESVTDHHGVARLFHTIKSPMRIDGRVVMSVGVSRRHDDDTLTVSPSHV
ncbi:MAG: PAS domain-containing protein, partial [Myxococcota bacterium]